MTLAVKQNLKLSPNPHFRIRVTVMWIVEVSPPPPRPNSWAGFPSQSSNPSSDPLASPTTGGLILT